MKWTEVLRRRFEGIRTEHEAIARGEDPRSIIPTGLREFDKRAGHKRKIFHLYGAATGEGKSIVKLHLMKAAAKRGYRVLVIDFEDPEERTADRDFAGETGINSARMMSGDLDDREITRIGLALAEMEEWADNIEYEPGLKTAEQALEIIFQHSDVDLLLVDYLSALPHGRDGREHTISDFCWALTEWAQCRYQGDEAGGAVVAFAQTNNKPSERGKNRVENLIRWQKVGEKLDPEKLIAGFRPFDASDLAWCTDAGRTAKELGFLFRPGRYLQRLKQRAKDDVMEFTWPKKNFGSEGTIAVGLDLKTATIYDLPDKKETNGKDAQR